MATISPSFDGQKLFDCFSYCLAGGVGAYFSAGELLVGGPNGQIIQRFHRNGEEGDTKLYHGYHDRTWTFRGMFMMPSQDAFITSLNLLRSYVEQDETETYTLTDSLGLVWNNAQLENFSISKQHAVADGGIICELFANGTVSGQPSYRNA